MIRSALLLSLAVLLGGCKLLHRKASKTDAGAEAGSLALTTSATDASAPALRSIDPRKDLPLGHWESADGSKFFLSLLPDALARWATPVPSYRNPARVFGDIKHAEAIDDDNFQITVDVTKILVKEIGPLHRYFTDYELFEAELLGDRVTSPNTNGQRIPSLEGGSTVEPPRTYVLHFDKSRANLEACTNARTPSCQKLVKRKSPSELSRARTGAECKVDPDCVVVTNGEQCDPCLCPSIPSVRSWPKRIKPEDKDKDESWERANDHLCGKPITRSESCAPCPELKVACKQRVCVLKN